MPDAEDRWCFIVIVAAIPLFALFLMFVKDPTCHEKQVMEMHQQLEWDRRPWGKHGRGLLGWERADHFACGEGE